MNQKSKTAILLVCLMSNALVFSALATDYNPGVTVGQYVKYGNIVASGSSILPDFNETDWIELEVTEVSGKNVTLHVSGKYQNGTDLVLDDADIKIDVETGETNVSDVPFGSLFIIAGNLTEDDNVSMSYLEPYFGPLKVNTTETRTYMGASRTVNVINVSISIPEYMNVTVMQVFDKASGMLMEMNFNMSMAAIPPYVPAVDMSMVFSAIETNIFAVDTTWGWLQDNMIYIIAAVVIIIIVAIAAVVLMKRKPKTTAQPPTASSTTETT